MFQGTKGEDINKVKRAFKIRPQLYFFCPELNCKTSSILILPLSPSIPKTICSSHMLFFPIPGWFIILFFLTELFVVVLFCFSTAMFSAKYFLSNCLVADVGVGSGDKRGHVIPSRLRSSLSHGDGRKGSGKGLSFEER